MRNIRDFNHHDQSCPTHRDRQLNIVLYFHRILFLFPGPRLIIGIHGVIRLFVILDLLRWGYSALVWIFVYRRIGCQGFCILVDGVMDGWGHLCDNIGGFALIVVQLWARVQNFGSDINRLSPGRSLLSNSILLLLNFILKRLIE